MMLRKTVLGAALVALVAASAQAELIPNGDFETGDFTDWQLQTIHASVQEVDGSFRAVISLLHTGDGPGGASGEILSASDTKTWGNGKILQFDASYSYETDSIGANAFLAVTSSTNTLIFLNVTQEDATPLSGSVPLATYSMPWDGSYIDVFPSVFTQSFGSVSLIVVLDNFQIIPEPSTWVLVATALCALPAIVRRRQKR